MALLFTGWDVRRFRPGRRLLENDLPCSEAPRRDTGTGQAQEDLIAGAMPREDLFYSRGP